MSQHVLTPTDTGHMNINDDKFICHITKQGSENPIPNWPSQQFCYMLEENIG